MPLPFTRTLRARLVLVALVAPVPLLALFAYSHSDLSRLADEEWREAVSQGATEVAVEYHRVVDQTRSLLSVLARVPAVRDGGPDCVELLTRLTEDMPQLSGVGRVDLDGYARCMVPDPGSPLDVRDRVYIQEALQLGEPRFSGFQVGRMTGRPVMSLAHPILSGDGSVLGAVAAGTELDRLRTLRLARGGGEGVTVTVYDSEGRILARDPPAADLLGTSVPWAMPDDALEVSPTTITEGADLDGQSRVFATRPLLTEGGRHRGFVTVGFDPGMARAGLERVFRGHVLGLLLAGFVLVAGIWITLELAFLRRLEPLLATAERLGRGDLEARTGVEGGPEEISALARTLDRMAESLQERQELEEAQAREAIREREARLSQFADSVDEVFWLYDPEGKELLYVNAAYERIYGRPVTELQDDPSSWLSAVHPEDRASVVEMLRKGRRTPCESIFRVVRPAGEVRWIRYRSFPARNDRGEVYRVAAVARDVTEERRMEQVLHQAGKLEAVGRLAGGIAHDFNNVLTVIRGYTQFLLQSLDEEDPVWHDVSEIDASASRAAALTHQLLAFSRKQPLHPRTIDVNRVIRGLERMLGRLVGEGVELAFELDPAVGFVRVDQNQLEQALINLAANARDAMDGGGQLVVRSENVSHAAGFPVAEGVNAPAGDYVRLTISDTGPGMEEEVRRHAFEPFFTTKEMGKGTGLGLASVYGTVKQSGGFIQVFSEPGQGASFQIDLPRVSEAPDAAGPEREGPSTTPSLEGSETVLVVEDEEAVLRVVRSSLERYGYRVITARSGKDGRERYEAHEEDVDLLLTDVVMPDEGRPELAVALRTRKPTLAVLFMSGYPDRARKGMEAADSPEEFIQKPFSPEARVARVREALDRSVA